jgi:hypothetical protein
LHDEGEAKKMLPQLQDFLGENRIGTLNVRRICRVEMPAIKMKNK